MEEEYVTLKNGDKIKRKIYSEYSKEELVNIIKNCTSFKDIIVRLKINRTYHTYLTKFVKENNIDTSHFEKGKREPFESKLIKNSTSLSGPALKKYLLKKELIKDECSVCHIPPQWNNKPLSLQVDHINGDHYDNRIENLRLICPNCHTQTDTYTGRNTRTKQQKKCNKCSKSLRTDNVTGFCAECISSEKHLCSICKKNPRPGKWSKCSECRKADTHEYKNCKKCDNPIKRNYNNTDYHRRCNPGEPFIKK